MIWTMAGKPPRNDTVLPLMAGWPLIVVSAMVLTKAGKGSILPGS